MRSRDDGESKNSLKTKKYRVDNELRLEGVCVESTHKFEAERIRN